MNPPSWLRRLLRRCGFCVCGLRRRLGGWCLIVGQPGVVAQVEKFHTPCALRISSILGRFSSRLSTSMFLVSKGNSLTLTSSCGTWAKGTLLWKPGSSPIVTLFASTASGNTLSESSPVALDG